MENTLSNKTQALTKSMNMNIWINGILNQIFKRGFSSQIKFSNSHWQIFVIDPSYTLRSICLNISF